MNGPHDMGGMQSFGPLPLEANEPLFHADWEARALALTLAAGFTGAWNIDMSRHARERIPPARYLSSSYYQIWLGGMETLLAEAGMATPAEIASGVMATPPRAGLKTLAAADVDAALAAGTPYTRPAIAPARFDIGERVHTATINPAGHTRLPRYARDKIGVIEAIHGCHVYPDANAHGAGPDPRWLYGVAFNACDLWGDEARAGDSIRIDLWEPYLEPA